MRDIKFRAWDYDMNEWTTAFDMDNDGVVYPAQTPYSDNPDIRIMQYTGLKDKNGVEIYEGDIVRVSYKGENGHPTAIGWVDYLKPSFIVRTNQDTQKPYYLCLYAYNQTPLFNWAESEIIGNIYENPGLLE